MHRATRRWTADLLHGHRRLPICLASKYYQKRKLAQLSQKKLPEEQLAAIKKDILDKSCICEGLAGGPLLKNKIVKDAPLTICCGPSIAYFYKIAKLYINCNIYTVGMCVSYT